MALSPSIKNTILNAMLGKSQNASIASTCYIGLLTEEPTITTEPTLDPDGKVIPAGTVYYSEPDTNAGYSRTQIGYYQNTSGQLMDTPVDGISTNKAAIFFPEATESWGTVRYFALFNAQTEGTPFLWGELSQEVTIPANYIPLFRVGSLTIKLT